MKNLFGTIQKQLERKSMTASTVGAFCIQHIKKYARKPAYISGKLVHHTLQIDLTDDEDHAHRHMLSHQILRELNELLKSHGYTQRVKKLRFLRKKVESDDGHCEY